MAARPILAFTSYGTFVKQFASISEAVDVTGVSRHVINHILEGSYNIEKDNLFWIDEDVYKEIDAKNGCKRDRVYLQYNITPKLRKKGQLKRIFFTIPAVCRATGLSVPQVKKIPLNGSIEGEGFIIETKEVVESIRYLINPKSFRDPSDDESLRDLLDSLDLESQARPVTNESIPLATQLGCNNIPKLQSEVSTAQITQDASLNSSPTRKGKVVIQMTPRWVFVEEFPSISAAIKKTLSSRYQIMKALSRKGNFDGTEDFFWLDKDVYDDLRQKYKDNSHDKGLSSLQNQITSGMLNLAAQLILNCYGAFQWDLDSSEIPNPPESLNREQGLLATFKQTSVHAVPSDKYFIYDYLENKFARYGTTREPASNILDSNQMAQAQVLFIEALKDGQHRFQSVEGFESFVERFTQHTISNILNLPISRSNTEPADCGSGNIESGTATAINSSPLVQLTSNWEYIQKFHSIAIASVVTGITINQINCVLDGDTDEKSVPYLWMYEHVYNLLEKDEEVRPILQFEILSTLHNRRKLLAEYPSVAAGSRLTGVAVDAIEKSLKGQRVPTDNYIWRDKMLKAQPVIKIVPPEPLRDTPSNHKIPISPTLFDRNHDLRPDEPRTPESKTPESNSPVAKGSKTPKCNFAVSEGSKIPEPNLPISEGSKIPEPNLPISEGSKSNLLRIKTEFIDLFNEVERRLRRYNYETAIVSRASLKELEDLLIKIRIQSHFLKSRGEGTVESYQQRIIDFERKILKMGKGVDEYERLEASFQSLNLENQETPVRRSPRGDLYKPSLMEVWDAHIGVEVGQIKCPYCKVNSINPFHFHTGHVIAKSTGGKDTVENLRPICSLCNQSMGANSMDLSKYRVEYPQRNLFI
jgi:hypothetical protein